MVWLLRRLVRLTFTAAAVGAVVWVAREAMRRWVDGPESPQVAGTWRADHGSGGGSAGRSVDGFSSGSPGGSGSGSAGGSASGGSAASGEAASGEAARGEAARGGAPAGGGDADTTGAPVPGRSVSAAMTPAARTAQSPKTGSPAAPAKKAPPAKAAPPGKAAPPAKTGPAKPAKAAKKTTRKAGKATQPSGPPAWVPPNGSGEAPETHPVKAKLINHLYRVPGMPMYNRMVADRCYPDPESAEADGFKRAAR